VVIQVKKATFKRMGSGGKGRTENRWDVSGGQSTPSKESYFHGKHIKNSQRLTVRATTSVPGDTADCCSVSEISI